MIGSLVTFVGSRQLHVATPYRPLPLSQLAIGVDRVGAASRSIPAGRAAADPNALSVQHP